MDDLFKILKITKTRLNNKHIDIFYLNIENEDVLKQSINRMKEKSNSIIQSI